MDRIALETDPALSDLVDRVAAGEDVTITRSGKAVAKLTPVAEFDREAARVLVEGMLQRARTEGAHATAAEIREWRDEGRR